MFPGAAVTNHYRGRGSHQQEFLLSRFWNQKPKIKVSAGPHSFLRPWERPTQRRLWYWWRPHPGLAATSLPPLPLAPCHLLRACLVSLCFSPLRTLLRSGSPGGSGGPHLKTLNKLPLQRLFPNKVIRRRSGAWDMNVSTGLPFCSLPVCVAGGWLKSLPLGVCQFLLIIQGNVAL